jgi:threonine dehydrogenase-like Zn-dependent dehydrogenase
MPDFPKKSGIFFRFSERKARRAGRDPAAAEIAAGQDEEDREDKRMRSIYVERIMAKMLAVKALGGIWPGVVWSPLSPVSVADLPEPSLPGSRWIRVSNLQCGICASDLSFLFVHVDPAVGPAALPGNQRIYLGHEALGKVVEVGSVVTRVKPGDRVIMNTSSLPQSCAGQEIEPVCRFCARGNFALCENQGATHEAAGVGGGWGDGFTAHESEVDPVPNDLSDDMATLVEPASVALHAVLRRPPAPGDKVLVVGAGIIGLLTAQAARAVCPDCHITVLARHPYQAQMARRLGANEIIGRGDGYESAATITGAKLYKAAMNKGMLLGGFDVIYDCVGSSATIEDSLRWARAEGAVVLVGIDLRRVQVDLNPIWYQHVDLIGSVAHGADDWHGRRRPTFDWVIDLMRAGKVGGDGLITHRFRFEEHRQAVATATSKASSQAIKVVFDYR